MITILQGSNLDIRVLELRNYLLKPNIAEKFSDYFATHFVQPMAVLGGYTLGQFKIKGVHDRFIWMRGFTDMTTRLKFLNDFYVNSQVWKEFGPGANDMMINSDNVYLLKPLFDDKNPGDDDRDFNGNIITNKKGVIVVDFYICNGTLEKATNLMTSAYITFIKTLDIHNISFWISEMQENKFPGLPAFQDKNLLLTITSFKDEIEYQIKQEQMADSMINVPNFSSLKNSMLELITTQSQLVLYPAG
ncbi:MAG: hypothetical protein ABI416_05040 [Ginsengibacter sp.]